MRFIEKVIAVVVGLAVVIAVAAAVFYLVLRTMLSALSLHGLAWTFGLTDDSTGLFAPTVGRVLTLGLVVLLVVEGPVAVAFARDWWEAELLAPTLWQAWGQAHVSAADRFRRRAVWLAGGVVARVKERRRRERLVAAAEAGPGATTRLRSVKDERGAA